MIRLDPLPKREILVSKIKESIEFIDLNRNIKIFELPAKYINLWRIRDDGVLEDLSKYPINDYSLNHPWVYMSFTIFSYIYYRYYAVEDYADFQNFHNKYKDFQQLLCLLSITDIEDNELLGSRRVFDLEGLGYTLDLI